MNPSLAVIIIPSNEPKQQKYSVALVDRPLGFSFFALGRTSGYDGRYRDNILSFPIMV